MLDAILLQRNVKEGLKISLKSIISVLLIAWAIVIPQLVHLVAGASGGITWLPMYLPVLIGGCLLGTWWGLGIGVMSPIMSYLITLGFANPMPALNRLPFMIIELGVFAAISGLFSKKIVDNKWLAFPAVLLAQVIGRLVFLGLIALFQNVSGLSVNLIWSQIQAGLLGLVSQAVIVPFIIISLSSLLKKEKNE